MKRIGYLYEKLCNIDNLILAEKKARRGKSKQKGILEFDKNKDQNLLMLQKILLEKTFTTSKYSVFKIWEPKERIISRLPYYPDRIVHHAVMNILEPIFFATFTRNTYSCVKNRGIHGCYKQVKKALIDIENTQYCLKFDIKKFYPSITNEILKKSLRRKFKDRDLLWLLDNIIDSSNGLPLGNYLSQWLANFYLTGFDHWLKENQKIKYVFRYCDDIVILAKTKEELHILFKKINEYLVTLLNLEIKSNHQVFPVDKRGIDFLGYRFYHDFIALRDSIKENFIWMVKHNKNEKSITSYNGWLKWCDSINLKNKYLNGQY